MKPTKIKIQDAKFYVNWDDGELTKITLANLRRNCPCAYCKKEREEESDSYRPLYSDEQTAVKEIKTVGSYALGVKWQDGHNTGIFEFNHLRELGNQQT